MKKPRTLALLLGLLVAITLPACSGAGGSVPVISSAPLPTLAPVTQPATTRPPLLIQFCNDDTGSFPRKDFAGANQLMAKSLEAAVSANQQGVTLFATAITHNTFDPNNTLDPAFSIPAIPAFAPAPTPVPTHEANDPVTDPATATAVSDQNISTITAYNGAVAQLEKTVSDTKADVAKDAKRLTSWNPRLDPIASSILGCFQLAAARFQNQSGTKLIYIASDLENNTDIDYTQNFVTSQGLKGAIVHVIYFVSPNATRAQEKRAEWCPLLKKAGAAAVMFSDPTASPTLSDVFNKDAAVATLPCQ